MGGRVRPRRPRRGLAFTRTAVSMSVRRERLRTALTVMVISMEAEKVKLSHLKELSMGME